MFNLGQRTKLSLAVATGIGTSIGLAFLYRNVAPKIFRRWGSTASEANLALERMMVIKVANTESQCVELVAALRKDMSSQRVLGFDCEWVQITERRPVALLQLASHGGLCALFQLSMMRLIPPALKELLKEKTILKVGVDPLRDANYLLSDHGINVFGTVDLRFLAKPHPRMGLASLASTELQIDLPKSRKIRTSNWESTELTSDQKLYAAKDALIALLVFDKLIKEKAEIPFFSTEDHANKLVLDHCHHLIDVKYRQISFPPEPHPRSSSSNNPLSRGSSGTPRSTSIYTSDKKSFRAYSLRKTPLYHNCIMIAPDGEVLCTCDVRKADWYVAKGLAVVVDTDPYKIQLTFEPSGRAKGPSGQYYTQEKENQCVVCGWMDSYLRKKIVPHEYRRYFPDSMKKHQSHDVLLLCAPCHAQSNNSDFALRHELGSMCNAPINADENVKVTEDQRRKKLRSAARALLSKSTIPEDRRKELANVILEEHSSVTPELLEKLKDLDIHVYNEEYAPHGLLVVEHFAKGGVSGLMKLERMWREHFLKSMDPKFLPSLWSVDHYHQNERQYSLDDDFFDRGKRLHASC